MFVSVTRTAAKSALNGKSLGVRSFSKISDTLETSYERLPAKNSLYFAEQGQRQSLMSVKSHAQAIQDGLISGGGFVAGTSILVALPHRYELVATSLAAADRSASVFAVDQPVTKENLAKIIKEHKVTSFVYDPTFCGTDFDAVVKETIDFDEDGMVSEEQFPTLCNVISAGNARSHGIMRYKDIELFNSPEGYKMTTKSSDDSKPWFHSLSADGKVTSVLSQDDVVAQSEEAVKKLELNADSSVLFSSDKVAPASLVVAALTSIKACAQLVTVSKTPGDDAIIKDIAEKESCVASIGNKKFEGKHFDVKA